MPESTITLTAPATSFANGGLFALRTVEASATAADAAAPSHMPSSIPADQVYYWSAIWQQGIADAMRALGEGDFEDFDSDDPNDVVRWLFRVDE